MNYIVIDLEWNQCPDGKAKEVEGLPFEVIEIGAIKLDKNRIFLDEFSQVVKPQVYKALHSKTEEIVPLSIEDLNKGNLFPDVMKAFLEWCGEDYQFCTWGPMDLVEIQKNMKYYNIHPFSTKPIHYYDVQKLFSITYEDKRIPRTLSYAVEYLKIEKEKAFHYAINDAKYTAKIFQMLDKAKIEKNDSIDYYNHPKRKEDEVYITYENYSKYISMDYKAKEDVMADKTVKAVECFLCHKKVAKKIGWFTNNSKNYYGLSYCRKHGFLKAKIRIKKSVDNTFFAVKTIKRISKEEAQLLCVKKEEVTLKRKERRNRKNKL